MMANDRIRVAVIGPGGMGQGDARDASIVPGVEIVAAADIYDSRLDRMKETYPGIATTRDYRELIARRDIDAVIIATPDHWHARISIDALRRGQGRLLREADGAEDRGRQARHRGLEKERPHLPDGQPVRLCAGLPEDPPDARRGRHRRAEQRRMLARPQHRPGRVAVLDPARRQPAEHRLGPLPRPRAQAALRAHPPVPLAQLPRLWHGRGGRPVRPPVHRPAHRHRRTGPAPDLLHRRFALLERRPRRARHAGRHHRLREIGTASAVPVHAAE